MKNGKGEILESTMKGDPVNYLHGSESILASLQSQLEGLKAGDQKQVYLQTGAGSAREDIVFEVIVDDVREALPEEIILGYPVKITVVKCDTDCDCYE